METSTSITIGVIVFVIIAIIIGVVIYMKKSAAVQNTTVAPNTPVIQYTTVKNGQTGDCLSSVYDYVYFSPCDATVNSQKWTFNANGTIANSEGRCLNDTEINPGSTATADVKFDNVLGTTACNSDNTQVWDFADFNGQSHMKPRSNPAKCTYKYPVKFGVSVAKTGDCIVDPTQEMIRA